MNAHIIRANRFRASDDSTFYRVVSTVHIIPNLYSFKTKQEQNRNRNKNTTKSKQLQNSNEILDICACVCVR